MNCQRVKKRLTAYLDGELDEARQKAVALHLGTCASCRQAVEALQSSWDLLGVLPEADPVPHFFIKVKARMTSQEGRRRSSRLERFLVPATTAAALVLGVWMGSMVGRNGNGVAAWYGEQTVESTIYLDTFDDLPSGSFAKAYIDLAAAE